MPNPVPGQKLANEQPAPATYLEAWDQQFAPLHKYEQSTGRQVRTMLHECEAKYLQLMGLTGLWEKTERISILSERLGMVMQIMALDCDMTAEDTTGTDDELDHRITGNKHYLGSESYKGTRVFDFRLPDEVQLEVEAYRDELAPLRDLMELREEAKLVPWRIFADEQTDVNEHPALKKLGKNVQAAKAKADLYAEIDEYGRATYKAHDMPNSLAYEVLRINSALGILRDNRNSTRHNPETVEHYRREHEQHESVLALIETTEQQLGGPLPDALKLPALDEHEHGHDTYMYGVIKGKKRLTTILNGRKRALKALESAEEAYQGLLGELEEQSMWGAGWPDGALNAPTREEWATIAVS